MCANCEAVGANAVMCYCAHACAVLNPMFTCVRVCMNNVAHMCDVYVYVRVYCPCVHM